MWSRGSLGSWLGGCCRPKRERGVLLRLVSMFVAVVVLAMIGFFLVPPRDSRCDPGGGVSSITNATPRKMEFRSLEGVGRAGRAGRTDGLFCVWVAEKNFCRGLGNFLARLRAEVCGKHARPQPEPPLSGVRLRWYKAGVLHKTHADTQHRMPEKRGSAVGARSQSRC